MNPVGYIVHVKSPGTIGGEARSYQVAQALGESGASVHLYGQVDHSFRWFDKVYPHSLKRPTPVAMRQLLSDFSYYNVGVVIERYQYPPFNPGFFAQLLRKKPLVFEVHGFPIDEYRLFAHRRDIKVDSLARLVAGFPPKTWQWLQAAMFRRAAHIIVTSAGTKAMLVGMGIPEKKVSVIYNRVDPNLFSPIGQDQIACRMALGLPVDGQLVLFAGTFSEELDFVFEAASIVIDTCPSVQFVFAVSGPDANVKALADKYAIDHQKLHIISAVPHQQMPGLLAAVDVVLAPYSLHSERFRQGFHYSPLKILEALAMKKSIVTIDVAELKGVFGSMPNMHFVESGCAKEWAKGILQSLALCQSPTLTLGRSFVMDGYRWQDAAQMYLDIIRATEERAS